jgi:hypothetical protein
MKKNLVNKNQGYLSKVHGKRKHNKTQPKDKNKANNQPKSA